MNLYTEYLFGVKVEMIPYILNIKTKFSTLPSAQSWCSADVFLNLKDDDISNYYCLFVEHSKVHIDYKRYFI